MGIDHRGAARELRSAALDVHRVLVAMQRLEYERDHGRVERPAELLDLIMNAEPFAWLRPLSALIVALDQMLELADFTPDDAATARVEAEALLASETLQFRARYVAALQEPDAVVAHARWRKAIAALPRSAT